MWVQRLEKRIVFRCIYQTGEYREFLKQSFESERARGFTGLYFQVLAPHSLKDLNIPDIGCGAGTLLNRLKNITLIKLV